MNIYLGTLQRLRVVIIENEDDTDHSEHGKYYLRFEEEAGAAVTFRLDTSDFVRVVMPAFEKSSETVRNLKLQLETTNVIKENLLKEIRELKKKLFSVVEDKPANE